MAIAAKIYDRENHFEMGHRILQQKFTLNNMISLLSNYQESLNVRGYVLLLNKLRLKFDNVDILYQKEGFDIDTANKKIEATGSEIVYDIGTLDEISNPEKTKDTGLSGSIMDYLPMNIAPKGEKQGDYFGTTIGPYDYWAILYAYKPCSDEELKKIASLGA